MALFVMGPPFRGYRRTGSSLVASILAQAAQKWKVEFVECTPEVVPER
jgi:hypothetical protein